MPTTREYEITYLVDPGLDESKRAELNAAIDTKIDEQKGVINTNTESFRRRLAYPIAKNRVGFMRALHAQLPPAAIAPLRHDLTRLAGVMRLTIIQSAPRPDVTASFFDVIAKPSAEAPKQETVSKKPAKTMTDEEVAAKIEQALEEEVK